MSVLVTESRAELGLEGEGENEKEVYPERPYQGDCFRYLKTGFCGYGSRCRFNHPRDLAGAYYLQKSHCKFGPACKYHHPIQGTGSSSTATTTTTYPIPPKQGMGFGSCSPTTYPIPPKQGMGFGSHSPVSLNVFGYPLRPGVRECSYYVKTGKCKFGDTCKFHHPQTTTIVTSTAPAPTVSSGQLFPMHSAIYQNVQLPAHLAVYPNPQPILGGGSVYAPYSLNNSQKENVFPERPLHQPMSTNKGKDVAIGGWAGFPEDKKKKGENVAAAASFQALKPNPWVQPAGRGGSPVTPPTIGEGIDECYNSDEYESDEGNAISKPVEEDIDECYNSDEYESDEGNAISLPVGEDIDESYNSDAIPLPVGEDIDEYNSDEYESDEGPTSNEERKNNKWNYQFFRTLKNLTAEQINDPNRVWHCPACKDGCGGVRWYTGLQPLVDHAKKVSSRVKIHRVFAELLEQELSEDS